MYRTISLKVEWIRSTEEWAVLEWMYRADLGRDEWTYVVGGFATKFEAVDRMNHYGRRNESLSLDEFCTPSVWSALVDGE